MRMMMRWAAAIVASAVCVVTLGSMACGAESDASEAMQFIKASADGWNFDQVPGGERFIPFGSNLVFDYNSGIGIYILTQEKWDPETIRKAFKGAQALNMNVMKVFLPIFRVLPDPQTNDKVRLGTMTPPLLERLDYVFQVAHETNIYVSLTLAEWGRWAMKWWQDGGKFAGRGAADGVGLDSLAVLGNFWMALAERYKDEPALFSYNFSVEFYIPHGNWDAEERKHDPSITKDRWGLGAWRTWLEEKYHGPDAINKAWGTEYKDVAEIPRPEIKFVEGGNWTGHYTMPQAMIADYNSFKECVTYRFLKDQTDAIRSVDKRHMIACGFHPHHPAINWMGAAQYLAGPPAAELDFLDYSTVHVYTNPDDYKPGVDPVQRERGLRMAIITARFAYARKPVVVEEMGHFAKDREQATRETINLLKALRGHVSGYLLWCLSDQKDNPIGPLDVNLKLNSFGEQWAKLAEPGGAVADLPKKRTPARTTIELDRLNGLAPVRQTEAQKLWDAWDDTPQPVDFVWPLNPMIQKIRGDAE